jgi:predicted RNA-binding Zn-ribbon protein involved in translation (DUF1610 family)
MSVIDSIATQEATKLLKKCPKCNLAGIKARTSKQPLYKCYKCGWEFNKPFVKKVQVLQYESHYAAGWIDLKGVLLGPQLRSLCRSSDDQHSFRPLVWPAFIKALNDKGYRVEIDMLVKTESLIKGGHKNRLVRVRVGQGQFRQKLLDQFGSVCAFTGKAPREALEACHLYSYAKDAAHHDDGGLLIRRDLHTMFDLGMIAVNPASKEISISEELADYAHYQDLEGTELKVVLSKRHLKWLEKHWAEHRKPN